MPTDLRLPRLDDDAAAFIRSQAAARGCSPQVVVERMVALTRSLVDAADAVELHSDLADGFLERAGLERFKLYYEAAGAGAA